MWKVTIRSLRAHKLRLLLTGLAVTLGVAFMAGTMVLTDTIQKTFRELFADVNAGTDAYVRGSESIAGERERVSVDLVEEVQAVDGVGAAVPELQLYAQLVDADGDAVGNPEMGAPTLGFNWGQVDELNPFDIAAGRAPKGADEIVVDRSSAEENDFELGGLVTVLTESAPKQYRIVGIATFGEADSLAGASVVLFSTPEARRIIGSADEVEAIRVLGDDDVSEDDLRARIVADIDRDDVEVLTGSEITEEDQNDIEESFSFFEVALLAFAGISLFVGCFIIFNTFSVIVAQRTREMALLRAVGAAGRQVTLSVLLESLVVGLLASLAGLGSGVLLALALKALLGAFGLEIESGSPVVAGSTVVVALVVGSVVTLVSAAVPAWRASRVPPLAAMRDVAIERRLNRGRRALVGLGVTGLGIALALLGLFGGGGSDALVLVGAGALIVFLGIAALGPLIAAPVTGFLGWPLRRFRGITGALATQNAVRNPRRTAATASALMIGVAIVVFFTVFAASAKRTLEVQIDRAFGADLVITSGGFGFGGFSPELAQRAADLPEVRDASGFRFAEMEVEGSNEFVVGFDPLAIESLFDVDPKTGSLAELGSDGIAVSEAAADANDWRVGSTVPVRFPAGGPRELEVRSTYGFGLEKGLSDYAVSLETFRAGYKEQLDSQVYVTLASGVSGDEGRKALDGITDDFPTAEVQDLGEFKETAAGIINQTLGLIYVLLFLAILIALIGIANTLALSVHERTRELGLLRAVGMSRRQVRSAVRWESVLISLLGAGLGLLVGLGFGWAVVRALRDEGFELFSAPPGQLALIAVAAAIAGVVAALLPARRAARLDVLRAISTE